MLARFSFPIPLPPDPSRPSPTPSLRLSLRSPALLLVRRRRTIYFRPPENSGTDSGEAARASERGNRRWIGWKMGVGALSEGDEVEFEEKMDNSGQGGVNC
ncbi:beta-amylase 7 [Pyrus ussuriensis x Pyrus communis]|uniref:Beta-amylase 7 n=1 Tax=Pyrus ussuriensis x Pyrus communis TaxID=2448454 RepID=A0A5N5F993_9ROSA|nr:beta-amylase 7 [Pyrus ussuriensis x Pyrus communis]KAB2597686.1 beta-amylase 7 [Pyrus ussuriensis x Pyrus communis]